jgi:hypothetical protein
MEVGVKHFTAADLLETHLERVHQLDAAIDNKSRDYLESINRGEKNTSAFQEWFDLSADLADEVVFGLRSPYTRIRLGRLKIDLPYLGPKETPKTDG